MTKRRTSLIGLLSLVGASVSLRPFSYADKIKRATVRLVFLPLKAHGYEAQESLSHTLWEMNRWLDTYVKPAEPVRGGK